MAFWRFLALLCLPLFCSCSNLLYYPDRVLYSVPSRMGLKSSEIPFASSDGTRLYGWFFPARVPAGSRPKGTITLFHGNAQNLSAHSLSLTFLVDQGYSLWAFDYRGYGKAEGDPSPRGTVEDGVAGLEQAWKLHHESGARSFIVVGQSLGGAVAMRSLRDFSHLGAVDLIVLDSTFSSYQHVARKTLARSWLTWPFQWLPYLVISDEFAPEEDLRTNTRRLLILHDEDDPTVAFECGREVDRIAGGPKEFWRFKRGRHISAFAQDEPENRQRFAKLLGELR